MARLKHDAHDYAHTLAQQYTPKTVSEHTRVIDLCIDGLCWYTDVRHIEESTRGIAHVPPVVSAQRGRSHGQ